MNNVILVNEDDIPNGAMEKLEAHKRGLKHRAISVYVFSSDGKMLLQQRASDKYHCGGQWSNTCCSHPNPGEVALNAARRRLREEMGLKCKIRYVFNISYCLKVTDDLIENEYCHVFFGYSDFKPKINPNEVMAHRYVTQEKLLQELADMPETFSPWFRHTINRALAEFNHFPKRK